MAQRIKVQDGQVVYEASDSTYDIKVEVNGVVNVTKEVSVGSETAAGSLSSHDGESLVISSDISIDFTTAGVSRLAIGTDGEFILNSNPGTSGQVLTSQGSGSPPVWVDSSGGLATDLSGGLANEIPFQSAPNTTTFDADFTYNAATGELAVGDVAVAGALSSQPGQSLFIAGDISVDFATGGISRLTIAETGEFQLSTNPGTSGQVLTSQGIGSPPIWSDASGTGGLAGGDTNEIPFQSAPSTTAFDAEFTYNATTGELSVGDLTASGSISSHTGESLFVASDISIDFATDGVSRLTIGQSGEFQLSTNPGTSGQVLTSQGIGSPPVWADSTGSGGITGGLANEIPFQSAPDTTTFDADFTYNSSTKVLSVNNLYSNTGESLLIKGDADVEIQTGLANSISITADGEVSINGTTGTSGQVLTSQGPGLPATWFDATTGSIAGGLINQVPFQAGPGDTTFDTNFLYDPLTGTLTVGAEADVAATISTPTNTDIIIAPGTGGETTIQSNVTVSGYVIRSVAPFAAAGSDFASATVLNKDINVISTASASQGVRLPTAIAGMTILIVNNTASDILVYPDSLASSRIDALSTGAGYTLTALSRKTFVCTTTVTLTQWFSF